MNVHLTYFAVLREERGMAKETRETQAGSFRVLYEELGFSLPSNLVTVAVNGAFSSLDDAPRDGDEVVFIPPVAGG